MTYVNIKGNQKADFNKALTEFKRAVRKSAVLKELRDREHFRTKQERTRVKRQRARSERIKAERNTLKRKYDND